MQRSKCQTSSFSNISAASLGNLDSSDLRDWLTICNANVFMACDRLDSIIGLVLLVVKNHSSFVATSLYVVVFTLEYKLGYFRALSLSIVAAPILLLSIPAIQFQ
jgi:hypothetical protein